MNWFSSICTENQRRRWHPTPVLLSGKSHGQRSLVGCSPWSREESDTTERLYFHFSLSCIGEGNGNPIQCSCLENPRDRGAWWATIYGVAQSRKGLKRLSSSSTENRSPSTSINYIILYSFLCLMENIYFIQKPNIPSIHHHPSFLLLSFPTQSKLSSMDPLSTHPLANKPMKV